MYERFTDRARQTFKFANSEAERFNHEYIGTEHILLGLIKEGNGVAAEVLKGMKLDLRTIRLEVEKKVQSGPEMRTTGFLPQTPRAKKVIEYAIEYSRDRNENYVGTFHILLGLLKEEDGLASQILREFHVSEVILVDAEKHYVSNKAIEKVVGALELEKMMAVGNQDFEKAAQIRDRMKSFADEVGPYIEPDRPDKLDEIFKTQQTILERQDEIMGKLDEILKRFPPKMERPPDCEHL